MAREVARLADGLAESPPETRLRLLLHHAASLQGPTASERVVGGREVLLFAYPELKIAIEYDSYAHHMGKEALVRDGARRNAVIALGWLPITATANDLQNGGHRLAIDVQRARSLRTGVDWAE